MASVLSLCSFRRPRWLSIQQRIFYGDLLQFWLCDTRPVLRFYHGLCGIQLRFFSWYWSFMGQAAIPCKNEVLLWAVHAHNSTKIQQQIWVERHNTSTMDQAQRWQSCANLPLRRRQPFLKVTEFDESSHWKQKVVVEEEGEAIDREEEEEKTKP